MLRSLPVGEVIVIVVEVPVVDKLVPPLFNSCKVGVEMVKLLLLVNVNPAPICVIDVPIIVEIEGVANPAVISLTVLVPEVGRKVRF